MFISRSRFELSKRFQPDEFAAEALIFYIETRKHCVISLNLMLLKNMVYVVSLKDFVIVFVFVFFFVYDIVIAK